MTADCCSFGRPNGTYAMQDNDSLEHGRQNRCKACALRSLDMPNLDHQLHFRVKWCALQCRFCMVMPGLPRH